MVEKGEILSIKTNDLIQTVCDCISGDDRRAMHKQEFKILVDHQPPQSFSLDEQGTICSAYQPEDCVEISYQASVVLSTKGFQVSGGEFSTWGAKTWTPPSTSQKKVSAKLISMD